MRYNIHGSDAPIPVITGPATQAYTVEYDVGDSWLGIRLRPDNGRALWQSRIAQAADTVLRGQDALSLMPGLAALKGGQMTAANLANAVEITMTLNLDHRLIRALDVLHASGGRMRIEKLARFAGCTSRHLNRVFRSNIGLTAKTYAQLVQFNRTLRLIQQEHLPITGAAFEGGYADHAHLTRAFRRFGGFTPSDPPNELSLPVLFS
ncbi:MAG: AraC family transcriptional regulator [Rhodobacteraceae bacterium]|nr:AraC family transcriptional regulator [Paracoccaceae bacterium]